MIALGVLLIGVPVLFCAAYALLGLTFSYPAILRRPVDEVLERFTAGGTPLLLVWWAFAMSALLFVPIGALSGGLVPDPAAAAVAVALGVAAGLVQALGLLRWVFLVPELARARRAGADPEVVRVVFAAFHRYLGLAVGEHVGYLATAAWTVVVALGAAGLPPWLAASGVVIGAALLVGSLEFVGPFERQGWRVAGVVVPIAYTLWAAWLVAVGIVVLTGR